MAKKMLEIGPICSGTLIIEELFSAIFDALKSVDPNKAKSYRWQNRSWFNWFERDTNDENARKYNETVSRTYEDDIHYFYDEVMDMLRDYCPEYTYLGCTEGDGADLGCWIDIDAIDTAVADKTLTKVNTLLELDNYMASGIIPKQIILITEHSEMSLYSVVLMFASNDTHYVIQRQVHRIWGYV